MHARADLPHATAPIPDGLADSHDRQNAAVGLQLSDKLLEECERTDNVEPIERAFKLELSSVDTEPFLRPGSWASAEAVGGWITWMVFGWRLGGWVRMPSLSPVG